MASLHVANELVKAIASVLYPVGSIYISTKTANPSSYLGGTWVRESGGFIYGSTNTSGNTYSTGNKGTGTSTNNHTLTVSQIPAHSHNLGNRMCVWDAGKNGTNAAPGSYGATSIQFYGWDNVPNTNNTGGGGAHNHKIPYIACSIWRRTA